MHISTHKTAITRSKPSLPLQKAIDHGFIHKDTTVLDYGSGKGFDVRYLESLNIPVVGFDPHYKPALPEGTFSTVMLSYVLNVIHDQNVRLFVLREAYAKAEQYLIVSVRMFEHIDHNAQWTPYLDGFITSANTFQHYYTQEEIQAILRENAPGLLVKLGSGIYAIKKESVC